MVKSQDWAYEREWRLMLSGVLSNDQNQYVYPRENVVGIVLGSNIAPMDMHHVLENVRHYQEALNRRVWVRQIEVDHQSKDYALKVGEPIRGI